MYSLYITIIIHVFIHRECVLICVNFLFNQVFDKFI